MVSKTKTSTVWIGLKDHIVEGDWRLLNGERFNPGDHSQPSLYFWRGSEPNSLHGNEDCAGIDGLGNDVADDEALFDASCEIQRLALCGMKHDTCL